jgi:hypothetical protein
MDENTQQTTPEHQTTTDQEIIDLLGVPTEEKPEYFEQDEIIDENIPGFDPPPEQEQDDPDTSEVETETVFDPESPGKVPRSSIKKSGKMLAPMLVNVIDTVAPMLIDAFAKTGQPEQFEADRESKAEMSNELADWIGESNIEMSAGMRFLFAVVLAYSRPCILAYQLKKAQKTVSEQKQRLDASERERLAAIQERAEAEKRTQQVLHELNDLKAKNAELLKKTAKAEMDAENLKTKGKKNGNPGKK